MIASTIWQRFVFVGASGGRADMPHNLIERACVLLTVI
jgi:hypothetical protein